MLFNPIAFPLDEPSYQPTKYYKIYDLDLFLEDCRI